MSTYVNINTAQFNSKGFQSTLSQGTQYLVTDAPLQPIYSWDTSLGWMFISNSANVALPGIPASQNKEPPVSWYTSIGSYAQLLKLLIATIVEAGSHVYTYNASNQMVSDAWTLLGTTRTKTYTYTNGLLTSESDWV